MKEQIKQLRLEIDGLAQLCEALKPIKDGGALHNILRDRKTIDIFFMSEKEIRRKIEEYREEYNRALDITSKNSQEIKEAVKSLKLSKAWLGKVLESLGSENPYGSGYKTVEDIVPETDKAEIICGSIGIEGETPRLEAKGAFTVAGKLVAENYGTHIEKVDWLRIEIKSALLKLHTIEQLNCDIDASDFTRVVEQHLTEARFWLGFELGRVRDESK